LSKIDAIEVQSGNQNWQFLNFSISHSDHTGGHTEVSADAATCQQCLDEIFDPNERRYLYPFTNCTHCGPRLSIVQGIPYDRVNTTMSNFPLCRQCKAEYEDPADRRFHAQPIACHRCGPRLYLHSCAELITEFPTPLAHSGLGYEAKQSSDKLAVVQRFLEQGKIVAVRGIGGFHLCCDATNDEAVARLRQRKHRYAKPFALMSHSLDSMEQYCHLSTIEQTELQSPSAPIVLLNRKNTASHNPLSAQVAPGTNLLGFMLPYTPLHWLLCQAFDKPLVMTSGNLSQEPQIIDNDEAIDKLQQIADLIVFHDREIANRMDDSVVRCMAGKPRLLRRARGFAPRSVRLPAGFENCPDLLAFGAELKSTFCLVKAGCAIVSQHQGDLEDLSTFDDYEKNVALYSQLFEHQVAVLAADKHPEYLSTKLAIDSKNRLGEQVKLIQVQHHHAHIASCLAENQIAIDHPKVLGVALDGLGFGEDGTIWGGEFMIADYCEFKRVGRFKPVAMIGGAQAIREPWRNTYAHILSAMPWQHYCEKFDNNNLYDFLQQQPLQMMSKMLERQVNVPLASSCGRLFDAVAGAMGICREQARFEGQGAIELEMLVQANDLYQQPYPFSIDELDLLTLDPAPMWQAMLSDLQRQTPLTSIATRFHGGLIIAISEMISRLSSQHGLTTVVLSGGCMQNKYLLEELNHALTEQGLHCLSHAQMPSNDGGISLGQAAVAAARTLKKFH
jgi:hydrogenase maturation protein HypF